jgi:hypothetical protein
MTQDAHRARAVAVVTGGSLRAGTVVARRLAAWDWPIVLVYLDDQAHAETTIDEIIAAGGTGVGIRADLNDDLDVERLFTESAAAFGGVDVVVHTTTDAGARLFPLAVRHVRAHGLVVSTTATEPMTPSLATHFEARGIAVSRLAPDGLLPFIDAWRLDGPEGCP